MELTPEDVEEILALLDSLPYDELDLQTPRFRLTLSRTPDGWTQSTQLATPAAASSPPASPAAASAPPASPTPLASPASPASSARPPGTNPTYPDMAPPLGHASPRFAEDKGPSEEIVPVSGPFSSVRPETSAARASAKHDINEMSDLRNGVDKASAVDKASGTDRAGGAGGTDLWGAAVADESGLVAVRAPLPGTFYRAPRPGAAPFVEVGSRVDEDTVVGIVETMKLMNPVHAGTRGRVAEICVGNAEFTPGGGVLLCIRAQT